MDIKVNLSIFKNLVKQGKINGPIFESKELLMVSVGPNTVYARKNKPEKYYSKDNHITPTSFPFLGQGYSNITFEKTKPVNDTESLEWMKTEFETYDTEFLRNLYSIISEIIEKRGE